MKNSIKYQVLAAMTIGCLVFGLMACSPSKPKMEEKTEAVLDEAKKDLTVAANEVKVAANEIKESVRQVSEREWKLMIDEMEQKIREDEKTMARLKEKMKITGQKLDSYYLKQIDQLELKFNNLQERMKKSDKRKSDWNAFKAEFDQDMVKMKEALKKVAE